MTMAIDQFKAQNSDDSLRNLHILNRALNGFLQPFMQMLTALPHIVLGTLRKTFQETSFSVAEAVGPPPLMPLEKEERLKQDLASGQKGAIVQYFSMVLERSEYPKQIPKTFHVFYKQESGLVTVDYLLPTDEFLPRFEGHWLKRSHTPRVKIGTRNLYSYIIETIALRTLKEI